MDDAVAGPSDMGQPVASGTPSSPPERELFLRVTPAFAFAVVGSVVLGFMLQRGFVLAHRTLGWAVACAVVALLLDPVVQLLERHMPRVLAIILSVLGIVGVAVLVIVQIIDELTSSAEALRDEAPVAAERLEARSSIARDLHVADTIRSFTTKLAKDLDRGALAHVRTAPTYVVTGVLMLFLLVHGRRYVRSGLAQIRDLDQRRAVGRIVRTGLGRGRNRLLLVLAQITVVTLSALTLFELLDLRASFVLAFVLGVSSVMPFVGVLVAGVPPAVMAYGFEGLSSAIAVAAFVVVIEVVDLLWWRRRCDRRTVEVGLFVPVVASLVGYRLYGVGGAVYGYALAVLTLALIAASDLDGDHDVTTWGGRRPE